MLSLGAELVVLEPNQQESTYLLLSNLIPVQSFCPWPHHVQHIFCVREKLVNSDNVNLKFSKHLKLSFSSTLIIHGQFDCQMKLSLQNYEVLHTLNNNKNLMAGFPCKLKYM